MTPAEMLVVERIRSRGAITFAELMRIALYDRSQGYYATRAVPMGGAGDYFTSPELHPAFAILLGSEIAGIWEALGEPADFILHEGGPGSGLLARDLLDALRVDRPRLYLAMRYRLEELSPALRESQRRLLSEAGHLDRVEWVDDLDRQRPAQVIFANELMDAMPVHLIERRGERIQELYVDLDGGKLRLTPDPPSDRRLIEFARDELAGRWRLQDGWRMEVCLEGLDWVGRASESLRRGVMILVDYAAPEAGAPGGSLRCYYQHTLSDDPLKRLGLQDITAPVDFRAIRRQAEAAGLQAFGSRSQRAWLTALGIDRLAERVRAEARGQSEREVNLRGVAALVDPAGLGREEVHVYARGVEGYRPARETTAPQPLSALSVLQRSEHVRLLGPEALDPISDFEEQWAELMGGLEEAQDDKQT